MSDRPEDRIRRGAEAMYESSTPVEDLIPPELADKAGKPPPDLVATRLRPPVRSRSRPGWAVAVVAVAAVLIAAVPLLLLLTGNDSDEADIAARDSFTRYNVDVTAHFEDNGVTVDLEAHGNDLEDWPATLNVNLDLHDGVNPCAIDEADYDYTDNGDDTITIHVADDCGSVITGPFDIVVVYEATRFHSQDIEEGLMCATTGVAEFNQGNEGADVIINELGVEAPMVADYKALIERCQPVGPSA